MTQRFSHFFHPELNERKSKLITPSALQWYFRSCFSAHNSAGSVGGCLQEINTRVRGTNPKGRERNMGKRHTEERKYSAALIGKFDIGTV